MDRGKKGLEGVVALFTKLSRAEAAAIGQALTQGRHEDAAELLKLVSLGDSGTPTVSASDESEEVDKSPIGSDSDFDKTGAASGPVTPQQTYQTLADRPSRLSGRRLSWPSNFAPPAAALQQRAPPAAVLRRGHSSESFKSLGSAVSRSSSRASNHSVVSRTTESSELRRGATLVRSESFPGSLQYHGRHDPNHLGKEGAFNSVTPTTISKHGVQAWGGAKTSEFGRFTSPRGTHAKMYVERDGRPCPTMFGKESPGPGNAVTISNRGTAFWSSPPVPAAAFRRRRNSSPSVLRVAW